MFPDAWYSTDLLLPVGIVCTITAAVVIWSYWNSRLSIGLKIALAGIKLAALGMLMICLLEPVSQFSRPKPGENILVVVADNSRSLQVSDAGTSNTRADALRDSLLNNNDWLEKLHEQFDVRQYTLDSQLERRDDFVGYEANNSGTAIGEGLKLLAERFGDRPTAGIVFLSDGNSTDKIGEDSFAKLPPVFPVMVGRNRPGKDLAIDQVTCSQTNFESAPVTITAEMKTQGFDGKNVVVQLMDETGNEIQRQEIASVWDDTPFSVRFQLKPEEKGVRSFKVRAFSKSSLSLPDGEQGSDESTIANNERTVMVNRGRGPFRVLYVSGRPNWEFKFLRRAIADDHELELVGLIRMAKREPKFTFRERGSARQNQMFKGFDEDAKETEEQHDEPVLIRIGTRDQDELRGGFPKDEATLYAYDAIILDDIEAEFFTADQKAMLKKFVTDRGGGLLMLGGVETFSGSGYDRTPIAELLPVYVNAPRPETMEHDYRLKLTREGWIQPWVRVKSTEAAERIRLETMPSFQTFNRINSIKPGATVLATVLANEKTLPALVVQKFGKGHSAALMVGDMWRWHLQTPESNDDLSKAWRQTLRWLVAEVPRRVQIELEPSDSQSGPVGIKVKANDSRFLPTDNAKVNIEVETPDGDLIALVSEQSQDETGCFTSTYFPRKSGPYRVKVTSEFVETNETLTSEDGWVADLDSREFLRLEPNLNLMERLAEKTNNRVYGLNSLNRLANDISVRPTTHMETRTEPWWHRWPFFVIAIGMLVTEWGIRRWKGLA